MKLGRITLALIAAGSLALPAPAGILFGKKTKPNPSERVPELIVIVKTDKDESKRAAAAEELRQYDPAANADIVPVLIDVLMNDPKPAVRVEAAESLGKLRPVSQEAGWALEQAREKDASMRVRVQARYSLMGYHWSGYHPDPKLKEGAAVNPKDQPAEKAKGTPPAPAVPAANGKDKGAPEKPVFTPTTSRPAADQTAPPPLAPPAPKLAPPPAPRPLPPIPAPPGDGGPALNPPGE